MANSEKSSPAMFLSPAMCLSPAAFLSPAMLLSLASILLTTGCINLDKRDPSPFRLGQKTKAGQTVATKGGMKKSIARMQNEAKGSGFANTVKKAWPFQRKTHMSVQEMPMAIDDPTRLDYRPKNVGPDLYLAAAKLSEKSGNYAKALEQYNSALKADGQNRNALIGLARLQHRAGKTDAAIRIYRDALDIYRNDAVIMNDLGICYARQKQLNESISMLRAATQAAPDREMYVNNLAASLVEAGRSQEAVTHLSRVRAPAVAHYNVGYLLNQSGRKADAVVHLNQALALDPNLQQARTILNECTPQVSSLPNGLPSPGYQIPAGQSERGLLAPKAIDPSRQDQLEPESPTEEGSKYLEETPNRYGPFGFLPADQVADVQVVAYVEPVIGEQPSPLQQVENVNLLPLRTRLMQPRSLPAGILVAPRPLN